MFLSKLRLRVFAVLAGLITAAIATLSLTALPAVPVIGVALITAAALVNGMTSRLAHPTCIGCGRDITEVAAGTYGVICPDCGAFTQINTPGHEQPEGTDQEESRRA